MAQSALIGQLYRSDRGQALAELLADGETDPDDLVRLRLIVALRRGARVSDNGARSVERS